MNKVIDLFAGCGGFSSGFEKAGFTIVKAVEFDREIANSYSVNHKDVIMINDDISKIDNESNFTRGEADIIIGGPPCQGFSMAGSRNRKNNFLDDPRNYLFKHYLEIVKIVRPKVFVMENVKGIITMESGKIFRKIIEEFSDENNFNGSKYNIYFKTVKANEFGIPQKRERVMIFGVLDKVVDFEKVWENARKRVLSKYSTFFDNVTVWDAISDLHDDDCRSGASTDYQAYLSSGANNILNHTLPNHSKIAVDRMRKIKPGQNWKILNEDIKSVHSGAYGRLEKTGIAPTITTRFDTPSGGQFIHPIANRTLSPREAARLQSFPDEFEFSGSKTSICKQIGNAVPPKLAYFIANVVEEI